MKLNKKGFTLIELLAVIVILAIIMVIAVPQILKVIDNSRASAWDNNVKLVEEALDLNTTLASTPMADFDLAAICTSTDSSAPTDITTDDEANNKKGLTNIAKISASDTTVTCYKDGDKYKITVTPTAGGQFANVPAGANNPAHLEY
ncbi:MAG: prepilin-type N-terminal cleavage/methylation domain-containing protein [Bacilli bacterium]|nr:prepilin-type N-terminal cleavage/methylation domain-containing protein [Bacilli bacterium]